MADRYVASEATIPSGVKQISFTFDDVPESTFLHAQPILEKYQFRGTFYLSLCFLELDGVKAPLYSRDNIIACMSSGHELGCHTYRHIHFYQTSNSGVIENSIRANQEKLKAQGIQEDFENFSYPYGEQTRRSKKIAAKFFKTCRGIDHGINRDTVDLHNLKAVRLYERQHSIDEILSILEDFDKSGGWLIFYTHDVQPNFSEYGCSPGYFERVVRQCKGLNIAVKTVRDGAKSLR